MRTKKKANEQIKKRAKKQSKKVSMKVKKYKGIVPDGFIVVTAFITGENVFVRKSSINSVEYGKHIQSDNFCIHLFVHDKFLAVREDQETILKML